MDCLSMGFVGPSGNNDGWMASTGMESQSMGNNNVSMYPHEMFSNGNFMSQQFDPMNMGGFPSSHVPPPQFGGSSSCGSSPSSNISSTSSPLYDNSDMKKMQTTNSGGTGFQYGGDPVFPPPPSSMLPKVIEQRSIPRALLPNIPSPFYSFELGNIMPPPVPSDVSSCFPILPQLPMFPMEKVQQDKHPRIDHSKKMFASSDNFVNSKTTKKTIVGKEKTMVTMKNKKKKRMLEIEEDEDDDEEFDENSLEDTDFFECGLCVTMIVIAPKTKKENFDEETLGIVLEHVFVNAFDLSDEKVSANVTKDLRKALEKRNEPKIRKRGRPPKKKRKVDENVMMNLGINEDGEIGLHGTIEIAFDEDEGKLLKSKMNGFLNVECLTILLRHVFGVNSRVRVLDDSVKSVSLIGVFESKLKTWEQFEEREEVRRKRKRDRERTRRMRKKIHAN